MSSRVDRRPVLLLLLAMAAGFSFPCITPAGGQEGRPRPNHEVRQRSETEDARRDRQDRKIENEPVTRTEELAREKRAEQLARATETTAPRSNERVQDATRELDAKLQEQKTRSSDINPSNRELYKQEVRRFEYSEAQRRSELWLNEGGEHGGHTLMMHTPRRPENIRQELRERASRQTELSRVSMFYDAQTADRAAKENINANRTEIETWSRTAPEGGTKGFSHFHDGRNIGLAYDARSGSYSADQSSRLIAIKQGNGWGIYSFYSTGQRQ